MNKRMKSRGPVQRNDDNETDTRPACCSKGGRHWILCWFPRRVVYERQRLASVFWALCSTLWASVKYWMAIAARFLFGALNRFLAPVKAYSIEVCRPEQQALGISVASTAWRMGVITGPAIGGLPSTACQTVPTSVS